MRNCCAKGVERLLFKVCESFAVSAVGLFLKTETHFWRLGWMERLSDHRRLKAHQPLK